MLTIQPISSSFCLCRCAGYVPLFGAPSYDIKNEREGDVPFEEQLRGIENVIKQGKVCEISKQS